MSSIATMPIASARRFKFFWHFSDSSLGLRKAKRNSSDQGLCASLIIAQSPLSGSVSELLASLSDAFGGSASPGTFDGRGGLSGGAWGGGLTRGLRKRRAVVEKGRRNMMDVSWRGFCLMALAVVRWKGARPNRSLTRRDDR